MSSIRAFRRFITPALGLLASLTPAMPALAQEGPEAGEQDAADGGLSIELNKLDSRDKSCLFTFVASSDLESDLDKVSYEMVLFDGEGLVQRMTVLDFQELPAGSTRVRQFNLPDTRCGDVSRVLVNDSAACDGEGVEPGTCMSALSLSSRSNVEFSN